MDTDVEGPQSSTISSNRRICHSAPFRSTSYTPGNHDVGAHTGEDPKLRLPDDTLLGIDDAATSGHEKA